MQNTANSLESKKKATLPTNGMCTVECTAHRPISFITTYNAVCKRLRHLLNLNFKHAHRALLPTILWRELQYILRLNVGRAFPGNAP